MNDGICPVFSDQVQLNSGNNVLYWRTTGFSLSSHAVKAVLLKNIAISGLSSVNIIIIDIHIKPTTFQILRP